MYSTPTTPFNTHSSKFLYLFIVTTTSSTSTSTSSASWATHDHQYHRFSNRIILLYRFSILLLSLRIFQYLLFYWV